MTVDFDLAVKSAIGTEKVEVPASSGNYKATDVIEIEVRNPNPAVTKITEGLVDAGKSWSSPVAPFGFAGTNTALLEVSTIPPINLGSRLDYLIHYPYGCIEQTTSSVFPQLYLDRVKDLSETEKWAGGLVLITVPSLLPCRYSLQELRQLVINSRSAFRDGPLEGVVIRREDDSWLQSRAKLVRADFTQQIAEHWRHRSLQWNRTDDFAMHG